METIITNLISKYLLPGTRVKSHENHDPCLAHFSQTHWQALLLCHRGSEPHILSLVEASPREPERGVRAALPALRLSFRKQFCSFPAMVGTCLGMGAGLRGHSQPYSFLGRPQDWLWVRNQFGKRSGDPRPESTTLQRISAPVKLGEKTLCCSSQSLQGT